MWPPATEAPSVWGPVTIVQHTFLACWTMVMMIRADNSVAACHIESSIALSSSSGAVGVGGAVPASPLP